MHLSLPSAMRIRAALPFVGVGALLQDQPILMGSLNREGVLSDQAVRDISQPTQASHFTCGKMSRLSVDKTQTSKIMASFYR
jgi:hypothetical protein